MLILSRKPGESIVIDGRIKVTVVRVEGEVVKVGIEAPSEVPVHRQEIYEEIQRGNREAITRQSTPPPRVVAAKTKQGSGAPSTSATGKPLSQQ
jgi:carbon storage regulator